MPDKDNLARFAEFARAVNARLEAGRASYGDVSFSRHPAVLWVRMRALRDALEGNAKTSAGASPAASGGI